MSEEAHENVTETQPNQVQLRDAIYIGKKPLMAYVTSTLIQLANQPTVTIKARGLSIGRAVDVSQIILKRMENAGYVVGDVKIGSETVQSEDGRTIRPEKACRAGARPGGRRRCDRGVLGTGAGEPLSLPSARYRNLFLLRGRRHDEDAERNGRGRAGVFCRPPAGRIARMEHRTEADLAVPGALRQRVLRPHQGMAEQPGVEAAAGGCGVFSVGVRGSCRSHVRNHHR